MENNGCKWCQFFLEENKKENCVNNNNIIINKTYKENIIQYLNTPSKLNKNRNCSMFVLKKIKVPEECGASKI